MVLSTATFAGGCFWCIEAAFNSLNGVKSAISGYTGGTTGLTNYNEVCTGKTGHAEAVQIVFDEQVISYETLLIMFFTLHDATQLNRQGEDIGTQYRSAIFYGDEQQKTQAEVLIATLSSEDIYEDTIKTEVDKLETFYPAEDHHQGYYLKNPNQGYCNMVITPKFMKFKAKYQAQFKK